MSAEKTLRFLLPPLNEIFGFTALDVKRQNFIHHELGNLHLVNIKP